MWTTKQIQRVIIHPKFDSATYANDIAIIELLNFANTKEFDVIPICLPVTPEMRFRSFDNLYMKAQISDIPVSYLNDTDCRAKHIVAHSILQVNQVCIELEASRIESLYRDVDGVPVYQKRTRGNRTQNYLYGVQTQGYFLNTSRAAVIIHTNEYIDWILYNMGLNDPEETETEQSSLGDDFEILKKLQNEEWFTSFTNSRCGLDEANSNKLIRDPIFPWIGWLHTSRNVTLAELRNNAIATYYSCQTDDCNTLIQEVEVRRVIIHPNYTKSPRRNDIALIEVWPKIDEYHPYIRSICIPWTENLRRSKPLRLTVSTINYFWINQKQLMQENSTSCQQRFRLGGFQLEEKDISICTIYSGGQETVGIVPGAPLQAEIVYDGERRHLLRGLSYDLTDSKRTFFQTKLKNFYMPQLFTDINPHLLWIMNGVKRMYRENRSIISNAASKANQLKSDQVHLWPIRNTRKRRLFDFKTCGADITKNSEHPLTRNIPWFGLIHRTNEIDELHKCAVILISAWYGITTASCAVNYTGDVVFSNNGSVHRFSIQKVVVHSKSRPGDLNINIALIQLAKSSNSLNPICLPVIDSIRTLGYKKSDLLTFSNEVPVQIKHGYLNELYIRSVGDRYVDSIYCQIYRNESRIKIERHQSTPLQLNSSICIHYSPFSFIKDTGSEVEGSPMFSEHEVQGVKRFFLRAISLKSGRIARYASMFYLEIDDFLDWILDNMNETLHLKKL
uniref:Peptidase S1 domain-containing protein n=1 Tax=Anopheles dirus TaxID=7168 RepID=A0A182NVM7_9DIPT